MPDSNALRVLHIASWYPSKKNPVEGVFVLEHVKSTALYNDVAVLYFEGSKTGCKSFYSLEDSDEKGIRTFRLRHKKVMPLTGYFLSVWSAFAVFRKLMREGWRPDVIHAHVYTAGLPAVLLGKFYGVPVIVTEHFSGFPRGLIKGVKRLIAKFVFERAFLVCPVSYNLKSHIEKLGIEADFQVVPNAVDTALFYPDRTRKERGPAEPKRLLTVAMLNPIKGIPYLLKALAMLRGKRGDFVLDIVGDGPGRPEYEEMVRRLELQEIVEFHGVKTKQEIANFMREADLFVLPSEWENLPCVLIEAMASGLPIVATQVGGVPEMVDEGKGVLAPPKDVRRLSEAINFMLDNLSAFSPRDIAADASANFSQPAVGKKFSEIYSRAVDRARRGYDDG